MKIVMLCRLYAPHGGGVERHVAGIVKVLLWDGHSVTVITEQFKPDLKLKEKLDGVEVRRIPYSALSSKQGVWNYILKQQSLFEKADIIQVHDVFWWYLPMRFKLLSKRVITTFHGYEGSKPPRWQAVVHRKVVELLSTKTMCVGEFMKKWYKAKPDAVTYGAADCRPTPLPQRNTAVFLGRMAVDTGISIYIKALPHIRPEILLDIYGDGGEI